MYDDVLHFWFHAVPHEAWWGARPELDVEIRERFLAVLQSAARAELAAWRDTPRGRLAEIIVLDQFSRNVHRGTAQAFAQDPMVLVLAQEAVRQGAHLGLGPDERTFLLMPYMHSESPLVHVEAERLFREFAPASNYEFELKHKAIVDRFGRYPHRNAILGRPSTPEEEAFLQEPGSSF